MLLRIGCLLALAYAALTLTACSIQDSVLFPTDVANEGASALGPPVGVEQAWIDIDGGRVEAWFVAGVGRSAESPGAAVIFFHGNASLIDYSLGVAAIYRDMGVSVLLPEYRGYGRSSGDPSQKGIMADMIRFRDWLAVRPEVDAQRIIYHGQSLGGGVAAALAADRPPAALILQSTFTSVTAMFARYGLPSFIVRHPFRTDQVLKKFAGPVLIMHGVDDEVIPLAHARRLRALAPHADYFEVPGGHNDIPAEAEPVAPLIKNFLVAHGFTHR